MKIQCDVCGAAAAEVVCCADEAALCGGCDMKIHAAENKLSTKHQRLLLSASAMPKCDICQEALGFFFCLEDRAVLCRKCDITTHKANHLRAIHQRILLTGVKVGLEPINSSQSSSPMSQFSEFEGNKDGVCKWSRSIQSVEELLTGNLGEANIGHTSSNWAYPVRDVHGAISTDHTTETQFNNVQNLGFLSIDDRHFHQQ